MEKISVIGAGSWGTALATVLERNGHDVTIWSIMEEEIASLNKHHEHLTKLPGVAISENIHLTTNLEEAVMGKDLLVCAVPSMFTRSTAHAMAPFIRDGQLIVNVAKGIEDDSLMTLTEILEEEIPNAVITALSGPSHAEEVGKQIPTTVVAGARKQKTAEYLQNVFMNDEFRVYTSPDLLGMEIGAALKNVIAIAAGMADGLGYGDNTKAALITRGIAEIGRLALKMGANIETIQGLTGIGDLIVTCASMHSRNRRAGILIGQGKTMQEAMDEVQMIVEGVYSTKAAVKLAAKYNVAMPIVEQVNQVLFEGKPAKEAVTELMQRDKKIEHSDLSFEE